MPTTPKWTLGFDADDTLWENERFFHDVQNQFATLLADYLPAEDVHARLLTFERQNLRRYGFGVKGFVLSMIETALDISQDRLPNQVIRQLIDAGHAMLDYPIELRPHARETVKALKEYGDLVVITKGDLIDQERKLEASGLADLFDAVEIVSDKTPAIYQRIFDRHGHPLRLMVGNSLKSDVLPAIAAGANGVHIASPMTWALEHAEAPEGHPLFHALPDLAALPALVERIGNKPHIDGTVTN